MGSVPDWQQRRIREHRFGFSFCLIWWTSFVGVFLFFFFRVIAILRPTYPIFLFEYRKSRNSVSWLHPHLA